jgi:hypothetical protein
VKERTDIPLGETRTTVQLHDRGGLKKPSPSKTIKKAQRGAAGVSRENAAIWAEECGRGLPGCRRIGSLKEFGALSPIQQQWRSLLQKASSSNV